MMFKKFYIDFRVWQGMHVTHIINFINNVEKINPVFIRNRKNIFARKYGINDIVILYLFKKFAKFQGYISKPLVIGLWIVLNNSVDDRFSSNTFLFISFMKSNNLKLF